MQKKIWTIAVTLPLLLLLGIATATYTRHVSQMYELTVKSAEEAYLRGDYAAAERLIKDMETGWEKREPLMQIWMPHSDTNLVRLGISSLRVGLSLRDDSLFLEQAALLRDGLKLLRLEDDLNWHNIL